MKEEKESINLGHVIVWSIIAVMVSCVIMGVMSARKENAFKEKRETCRLALYANGDLNENFDYNWYYSGEVTNFSEAQEKIEGLEKELGRTNEEINNLRVMFACYFAE